MDNPLKTAGVWAALAAVLVGLIMAFAYNVEHTKYPKMNIVEGKVRP